jgi:hypothetical protein
MSLTALVIPRKAACSGPARHFALIEDPREAGRVAHPAGLIEFLPILGPMANLFPDALGFVTLWYLFRNWRSRRVKNGPHRQSRTIRSE